MALDLKGAKKIGVKWAIWSYEKGDWGSVSVDKPDSSVPSDSVFMIDSAIEMQAKGIEPRRRGAAQQQGLPQQTSPYQPPVIPQYQQAPIVQRSEKPSSFFSLPSPEKLAEQQKTYQAPPQTPTQQMPAPRMPEAAPKQIMPALPTIRPTQAEIITPVFAGGIAMGVIMGIPILNLCIPAWLLGGFLAVFLLLEESPIRSTLSPEYAAKVGAFAGLVGAAISLIVSFITAVFVGTDIVSAAGGAGSQTTMMALNAMGVDNDLDIWFVLFSIISRFVLFPLFGALGAVVYVKYGRKSR